MSNLFKAPTISDDHSRLRLFREGFGIARERLAAEIGISPLSIKRWETGVAEATPANKSLWVTGLRSIVLKEGAVIYFARKDQEGLEGEIEGQTEAEALEIKEGILRLEEGLGDTPRESAN